MACGRPGAGAREGGRRVLPRGHRCRPRPGRVERPGGAVSLPGRGASVRRLLTPGVRSRRRGTAHRARARLSRANPGGRDRLTPPLLRAPLDEPRHHPAVLADLAVADEAELLVGRQRAVEEKPGRHGSRVLGAAFDRPAALTRDEIERTGKRCGGDALAPAALADEAAGDPPV